MTRTAVCYGDSNTHGANPAGPDRFSREVRWPGVFAREIGPGWHVVEEGLGGRTTISDDPFVEGRNGRAFLLACLETHEPVDLLTIMLGTNDLKAVYRNTPQTIAAGMVSLVRIARRSECGPDGKPPRILIIAPAPVVAVAGLAELWGFADAVAASRELARLYRIAAEDEGVEFLDGGEVASVDAAEGVHLTADSHDRLGRAVAARVAEWFPAS